MAEGQENRDREDLSEEISAYRLEEFRSKGQVSQSKELSALAAMVAAAATLYAMSGTVGSQLVELLRESLTVDSILRLDFEKTGVLAGILMKCLKVTAVIVLPVAMAGFILGALTSFSQIGSIFSTTPLEPTFEKISPLKGIARLFSRRHFQETAKILVKAVILFAVIYGVIKKQVFYSPSAMGAEGVTVLTSFAAVAKGILIPSALVLAVFAAIDFALNRIEYRDQLRLTKQEAKQEHKEREGDPQIKARIRAVQREVARRRMMQAVKKADVIVTNPTHIAIAIQYDRENMAAPKVIAKGADFLAQKIKKIAAEAGVPLVENVPLARTLFKSVKVGQHIPRALYQAVAEVLAHVYRLKNRML